MDNCLSTIKTFNADRIPELIQLKYKFMHESMYRFFRGTCNLFYKTLQQHNPLPPSPLSWICGDLHLENFGSYKGDNRLVYFDLNDFDEAVLAPAGFELVRMVASILVAFESLQIEQKQALSMAQVFLRTYSATLAKGKAFYIESRIAKGIVCDFLTAVGKRKQENILKKRTVKKKNKLLIDRQSRKHLKIDHTLRQQLFDHMRDWIRTGDEGPYNFEVKDVVFRIAGTGSLGLKRYAFLLHNLRDDDDYMLVEMKEARQSSLLPYIDIRQPAWSNHAERVVTIQQRMQNIPPALLTHTLFQETPFIVQEMQPMKDSIKFKLIKDRYRDMYRVVDDMALLTASSQLRSSGREGAANADELVAFGGNDQWQQTVIDYAVYYMEIIKRDFKLFSEALKDGYFKT